MYITPLCLLLVGATICLSVQNPPSDTKQHDVDKEAMAKAIPKELKIVPRPIKELKKKVPKYILDSLNKQAVNESEASGNRQAGDPSVRTTDSFCSRHDWMVNLQSFWGSIIRPVESVNLYYCSGNCTTISEDVNSDARARLQAIDRSVPSACCTPIQYSDLRVVQKYPGSSEFTADWPIIVQACGCR